jgi:hypothetical protein
MQLERGDYKMIFRYPMLKKNWNEFKMWKEIYNERKKNKKEVKIEVAERFAWSDILISYEHTKEELKDISEIAKECILEMVSEQELKTRKTKVIQTKKTIHVKRINKKYVNELTKKLYKLCEENLVKVVG